LYEKCSSLFAGGAAMPSLQVRELPEHIYQSLCHEAEAAHRSIAQQAVAILAKGLNLDLAPQMRRKALLSAIQKGAVSQDASGFPDPALLIREDRDR
jgi:plasmid stability protein